MSPPVGTCFPSLHRLDLSTDDSLHRLHLDFLQTFFLIGHKSVRWMNPLWCWNVVWFLKLNKWVMVSEETRCRENGFNATCSRSMDGSLQWEGCTRTQILQAKALPWWMYLTVRGAMGHNSSTIYFGWDCGAGDTKSSHAERDYLHGQI